MILDKLIVVNYKSCREVETDLLANNPNVFIGINDSGKSTILESAGLLLDEKAKVNFVKEDKVKRDVSNHTLSEENFFSIFQRNSIPNLPYNDSSIYIIGKFIVETDDIAEDLISGLSSHLLWVLEKAENSVIWVSKTFNDETKSSTYHLLTPIGNTDDIPYFNEKATSLSKIVKEKKISPSDIENENKRGRFKNIELIRAIMNKLELEYRWIEYKFDKQIFPIYRYLDWNISLDQLNQFTKETMTEIIQTEVQQTRAYANTQRLVAQDKLNEGLETFSTLFSKEVPNISRFKANIYFDVEPRITDFILNKTNCDGDIHIESQGEGIKRQIWFSLIKWNALHAINSEQKNKRFFWCFDEPETHLFPSAQREFYKIIKQTSNANVQCLISTHSTIFVDKSIIRDIYKVDLSENYSTISKCNTVEDVFEVLRLKNSDFLFFDKFLVVEGDTEELLIPHFYKLSNGSTISNDNVQLINLGGKDKVLQNARILDGLLSEFKKPKDSIVYLFDNDAQFDLTSGELRTLNPVLIGSQDIEDSFPSETWKEIIDDLFEEDLRLTLEELQVIKDSIPNNVRINANQKFYPKVKNAIKSKLRLLGRDDFQTVEDRLPSKGKESGAMIVKYIKTQEQVSTILIETLRRIKASS